MIIKVLTTDLATRYLDVLVNLRTNLAKEEALTLAKNGFKDLTEGVGDKDAILEEFTSKAIYTYVVAEHEGKVLGGGSISEDSVTWGIEWLYVKPEHRNHGVGRAILRDMIDYAKDSNAPYLSLSVAEGSKAIKLYESLNFKPSYQYLTLVD